MNPLTAPTDPLFLLEQRIARRADELSLKFGQDADHGLGHWQRAEREVWDELSLEPDALARSEAPVGAAR